ncbi:dnaJ-like protein subfamily B member 6-A-like [Gossypium australe]|uniref:DnaJ-like protein subfamily B member 6-A-like n=2 Tax=Gossypium TaxID=3633 RepID=A0A5B6WVF1_9ROSI|nr:dnaJ-like protein subfamily B member 6-A-like [Gossypium australe]
MRVDWDDLPEEPQQPEQDSNLNFDFFSLVSKPKDYYKILEVDYDATEDAIRSNYIRLALKWHPDKQKDDGDSATSRFQEINEAYQVLIDPVKRSEYDKKGMLHVYDYDIIEYLNRYKGLILTCNAGGTEVPYVHCHNAQTETPRFVNITKRAQLRMRRSLDDASLCLLCNHSIFQWYILLRNLGAKNYVLQTVTGKIERIRFNFDAFHEGKVMT